MADQHEEWLDPKRKDPRKELLLLQGAKLTKERPEKDKHKEPRS